MKLYRLDSSTLSHDKEVVKAYDNDPLVYRGKLTARLAIEFLWAMHKLESRVNQIQLPLLVMHGTGDNLCSPEGSRFAHLKAGSKDKTLKLYDGFYHEILNEPWNYLVLDDIAAWLKHFK
jgi:alpha-beta hydrolase superfamily lysophospholipase